jgi:L-amino acid N-acyltransferase YncA
MLEVYTFGYKNANTLFKNESPGFELVEAKIARSGNDHDWGLISGK